ncbi:MAG: anthranilate synthase component 1 [Candidatus Krumholzibacteriia bacterium]
MEEAMISPTRNEYVDRTAAGHIVPVRATIAADLETPVSVYLKLQAYIANHTDGSAFLFESIERGVQMGRYSFIGLSPESDIQLQDGVVSTKRAGESTSTSKVQTDDPFAAVRSELSKSSLVNDAESALPPPFGGAVGYVGFDIVKYFENISLPSGQEDELPDFRFMFPRTLVVFDHVKNEIEILTKPKEGDAAEAHARACLEIEAVLQALDEPLPATARRDRNPGTVDQQVLEGLEGLTSNFSRDEFMEIVEKAQEHILAGDAFQIVLSQRLTGETKVPPFQIYRALRILNPSPYLFFLDFGEFQLIGSSPEMMVRLTNGHLQVNPIAGTRPRGDTIAEDNELAESLLADEKERAEHVMLVDLGRNDLGRVCQTATVKVDEFMAVERYSHVMHLVSRVSGQINEGLDMFDALKATFPAGTVSGAPKIRAMEILSGLEQRRRGHYAGAVGYFGRSGDMDMCITIRTMLIRGKQYTVQAGAGIVADSEPAREYQESLDKLSALTRAVRIAEEGL